MLLFRVSSLLRLLAVVGALAPAALSQLARPNLTVPGLTEIRDILAQLESPIVSALTERMNLATDLSLYENGGAQLLDFLASRESTAALTGRYDYGKLEYSFTLLEISPDVTTYENEFPPGRFHQDTFNGNTNITNFYLETLVPFFNSSTSFYYHLDNSTNNTDATLNADVNLLQLLSHRAHIGKIVAETKYASNVTIFTHFIKANNSESIRTLVTNTTQEEGVLSGASTASSAFSSGWITSGALVPSTFPETLQAAAGALFRELIDITTEIEIEYLLQRLN